MQVKQHFPFRCQLKRKQSLMLNLLFPVFAERGVQPLEAGHQEGQVALLPIQHPLELRHAASDLGGP